MSEFYASKTIKANKHHKCERCRGKILSGSFYVKTSGVYEGHFFTYKAHAHCEQIMGEVAKLLDLSPDDSCLELPDEISESIDVTGMKDIAIRYNNHAVLYGGVTVDINKYEDQPNPEGQRPAAPMTASTTRPEAGSAAL